MIYFPADCPQNFGFLPLFRMSQHIAKCFYLLFLINRPYLLRHPPQINCPSETVKCLDSKITIRILALPEWSLNDGSNSPGREPSQPPTQAAQEKPEPNSRIQSSFIGSFCPGVSSPHLHGQVYFTESLSETAP